MEKVPIDWRCFNHPKIVFAEKKILHGKADTIQQHELKVSRDMVVDYLAVSEETLSLQVRGSNETFLHWMDINWGVVERASWVPIGLASMEEFHNFYEGDRTNVPINPFGGTVTMWGPLRWRHSEPWIYNPIDTLSVDITTPPSVPPLTVEGLRNLVVCFDGVGLKSGLRRVFRIPVTGIDLQFVGQIFSRSFSAPQLASNLGDEPFKVQSVGISFTGREWSDVVNDWRILNFIRMRVTPSIGDSWSDTPVPLAFYGIHQSSPWRVAYHKPAGGPIFLYAGQSIVFQIQNNATVENIGEDVDLNVQVALIGRTAPGIGSLL